MLTLLASSVAGGFNNQTVKAFAAEMETFDPDQYVDEIVHAEMERAPKTETATCTHRVFLTCPH